MHNKLGNIKANTAGPHDSHALAHFTVTPNYVDVTDHAGMIDTFDLWRARRYTCSDHDMIKVILFELLCRHRGIEKDIDIMYF